MRRASAPGSTIGSVKTILSSDMVASAYGGCNKNENKRVKEANALLGGNQLEIHPHVNTDGEDRVAVQFPSCVD